MMASPSTAELTVAQRGMLSTSASAASPDYFSGFERLSVSTFEQAVPMPRTREYFSRGQSYTIQWQDCGQPLPDWFDGLMQGFVDLLTLPPNWDSYTAGAIDRKVVRGALNAIKPLMSSRSPAPRVVPLSSGGLQLEWHRHGVDLEVVFDPNEDPFFYCDRGNGDASEYALAENIGLLRSIIGSLE